jgi:hypothetical protein
MTQPVIETTFYQDPTPIYITSTRVILGEQTFILRNIAIVSIKELRNYHIWAITMLLCGIVFTIGSLVALISQFSVRTLTGAGPILIISILFIWVASLIFNSSKPYYALIIGVNGTQNKTIVSTDPAYISMLVNRINFALQHHT